MATYKEEGVDEPRAKFVGKARARFLVVYFLAVFCALFFIFLCFLEGISQGVGVMTLALVGLISIVLFSVALFQAIRQNKKSFSELSSTED